MIESLEEVRDTDNSYSDDKDVLNDRGTCGSLILDCEGFQPDERQKLMLLRSLRILLLDVSGYLAAQ